MSILYGMGELGLPRRRGLMGQLNRAPVFRVHWQRVPSSSAAGVFGSGGQEVDWMRASCYPNSSASCLLFYCIVRASFRFLSIALEHTRALSISCTYILLRLSSTSQLLCFPVLARRAPSCAVPGCGTSYRVLDPADNDIPDS